MFSFNETDGNTVMQIYLSKAAFSLKILFGQLFFSLLFASILYSLIFLDCSLSPRINESTLQQKSVKYFSCRVFIKINLIPSWWPQ